MAVECQNQKEDSNSKVEDTSNIGAPGRKKASSGWVAFKYFIWLCITAVISRILSVLVAGVLHGAGNNPGEEKILDLIEMLVAWGIWLFIGWWYGGKRIGKRNIIENWKEVLNIFSLLAIIPYFAMLGLDSEEILTVARIADNMKVVAIVVGLFLWLGVAYWLAWCFLPGRPSKS